MMREPVLPAVRAAVFAAVCLGLGLAAHLAMSDTPIPPWAIVLGGIGVYVPARLGSRRECGLLQIAALMGVLQFALHVLFAYAQATAISASMPGMTMPAGTSMAMPDTSVGMRMSPDMVIVHALAALGCAWWLRRGEAAAHALVRSGVHWIVGRIAAPIHTVPVPVDGHVALQVEPVALALRSQWLRTNRVLRGPPMSPSFT